MRQGIGQKRIRKGAHIDIIMALADNVDPGFKTMRIKRLTRLSLYASRIKSTLYLIRESIYRGHNYVEQRRPTGR